MIFDTLCGIVERHLPVFLPFMHESAVFEMPRGFGNRCIVQDWSDDQYDRAQEDFFLPFKYVAVEDDLGCVILIDTMDNQRGLQGERITLSANPLPEDRGKLYITSTTIIGEIRNGELGFETIVNFACIASKLKMEVDLNQAGDNFQRASDERQQEFIKSAADTAHYALDEIMWLNQPDRFILEKSPAKQREIRSGNHPRVWRSGDRPIYTILEPHAIREKLMLPTPTDSERKSMTPHDRRRHFRTFKDEKFVRMRGKTIIVDACWVGPSERVIGNHRYKVRLDL